MDRLPVGLGIVVLAVALGSCATSTQTTTLPTVPLLAHDLIETEPPTALAEAMAPAVQEDTPAAEPEIPTTSLVAPERRIDDERARGENEIAMMVPRPPQAAARQLVEEGPSTNRPEPEAEATVVVAATSRIPEHTDDRRASTPAPPVEITNDTSLATPPRPAQPVENGPDPARGTEPDRATPVRHAQEPVRVRPAADDTDRASAEQDRRSPTVAPSLDDTPQRRTFSGDIDELIVELPGEGWIYVGAEQRSESVRLRRKRTIAGNTNFTFEMDEVGSYTLWFQRQDSRTGSFDNEAVSVVASDSLAGAGHAEAPSRSSSAEVASTLAEPQLESILVDYAAPLALIADGELTRGVRLLLDVSDNQDPQLLHLAPGDLVDVMARSDELPGDLQRVFLERVAASEAAEAPAARSALLDISIARSDPDAALAASNGLILAGEARPDQLLDAAGLIARDGNNEAAVSLAIRALGDDTSPHLLAQHLNDEALFLRARKLEELGPNRDLRKALEFYEAIVADFPLSSRWEESRTRVSHLRRHYFDVR